jgi:membrane protein DedA with SNARE-associated domain
MRVPRARFFAVLVAARLPRYFALAYLGQQLRENSTTWLRAHLWHLGGVAAGIAMALYLLVRWVDSRRAVTME